MHLIFMHFNQVVGPEIVLSLPDRISNLIEQKLKGYFGSTSIPLTEILFKEVNITLINLLFEITSPLARGKTELVMLSTILDGNLKYEQFYDILKVYSAKILSFPSMYKVFAEDCTEKDAESDQMTETLKMLFNQCYKDLEKVIQDHVIKDSIVRKFKKVKW